MKKKHIKDVRYQDIEKLSNCGYCPPYGRGMNMLSSFKAFQKHYTDNLKNDKLYRKFTNKYRINCYEVFLINSYTSTCFNRLNQSLFKQFHNEKDLFSILFKYLLNKSLNKFPFHSNKIVVIKKNTL